MARGVLARSPSKALITQLRQIANVLARTRIRWPDGSSSSSPWTIHADDAPRGRPQFGPAFTLDSRLQVGESSRARDHFKRLGRLGGKERAGLRLVPLVRPRVIAPEPSSKPNTLAAQFAYVRHLWRHFVRVGLESGAGARVTRKDRTDLADAAQLPRGVEDRMPDHLAEQNVIVRVDAERWAPADSATRTFIMKGERDREEKRRRRARLRARL